MNTKREWCWSQDYLTRHGEQTWTLLDVDGAGVLSCDGLQNSPPKAGRDDILAALNSHAALVAALEGMEGAIRESVKQLRTHGDDGHASTLSICWQEARCALALSKGGGA